MSHPTDCTTRPLPADEARRLVVDLEHQGIDTGRISVSAGEPTGISEISAVDQGAMVRPLARTVFLSVVGVAFGLFVAALLIGATSVQPAPVLVVGAILGSTVGLIGLYWRLPLNTEVFDVEAADRTVVAVDTDGLDQERAVAVTRMVRAA